MTPRTKTVALAALGAALLTACATRVSGPEPRTATIQRTAHGVAHVDAPELETLAYGLAYAYAQDNVCMVADQMVTARGERSRWFGPSARGLLGRRLLPNEQIDLFVAAHMDDAALARSWTRDASADAQALARGYVAGYNRYLADHAGRLPATCNGQPWVRPMTAEDHRRSTEITMTQAGVAALADALLGAAPPPRQGAAVAPQVTAADAAAAMREAGLLDSPLGSNAWAFGRDVTANGRGLLIGNPHFPWSGVNRFWQVHLSVPGRLDAMGAAIGLFPMLSIGFNSDVAWSNTVSTGKRFTLHELALVPGDPTSYLVDGQPRKMSSRNVRIAVRQPDGSLADKTHTVWSTLWGPVVVVPRAGLTWSPSRAYALKDVNAGQARAVDVYLAQAAARDVAGLRDALKTLGTPWVNTIAADRHGNVLYADVSTVPDVDAAHLERCAPSAPARALRRAAGLVVLDGSQSACDWRHDASSAQPGAIPFERMPKVVRSDWVHNSNDSFHFTNPAHRFGGISPLVGEPIVTRPRTRSGLQEVPALLARGKVTPRAAQAAMLANRNFMAQVVLPDLLAACGSAPPANADARDGCAALAAWDSTNEVEARGAHLFREFWRTAREIPGVHRVAFDPAQPVATPAGLKMADPAVAGRVWDALSKAVTDVRRAGFALDASLGTVQRPQITGEPIALHGGDEFEGVLNNLGNQFAPGISARGLPIDYGTSYLQSVTFDERGPVVQAVLTYGQSTDPQSPHANDQMRLFSRKQLPVLPFHAEDIVKTRIGEVLRLTRP